MMMHRQRRRLLASFASDHDPLPLSFRIELWDLREAAIPSMIFISNISAANLSGAFGPAASMAVTLKDDLKKSYILLDDFAIPNQGKSKPLLLHEKQRQHDLESISFDFRTRDNIVVSARRSKYKSESAPQRPSQHRHGSKEAIMEGDGNCSSTDSDASLSEREDANAAEETCSEGSTDFDSAEESSDDGTGEHDEYSSGEDVASPDTASEDSSDSSYDSSSSYDEDGYPKTGRKASDQKRKGTFASGVIESDSAFRWEVGETTRARERRMPRLSERKDMIHLSLSVYDIRSGDPVRLFHFQQDLPVMLYSSPPAIHPSKSLVAWPLGGGDVLFADYMANTYFIRGAVPNTQDSKRYPWTTPATSSSNCIGTNQHISRSTYHNAEPFLGMWEIPAYRQHRSTYRREAQAKVNPFRPGTRQQQQPLKEVGPVSHCKSYRPQPAQPRTGPLGIRYDPSAIRFQNDAQPPTTHPQGHRGTRKIRSPVS